jgi:hypothetical protein
MKNPFGDQQIPDPPGSYENVKERMYKKVSAKVNDQIRTTLQNAYENALGTESIVLSRSERKRLFAQIVKMIMEEMVKGADNQSSSN